MQDQRKKLITDFPKKVVDMYKYAYRRCKQKHKILEDLNIDEDFMTNEESDD